MKSVSKKLLGLSGMLVLVLAGSAFAVDDSTSIAPGKQPGAARYPIQPAQKKDAVTLKPGGLEGLLVRPELIIKFADQIGLTQDQQQSMRTEVESTRIKLADAQSQLRGDTEALNAMLAQSPIDQNAAMGQLDKVLDDERTIKRSNLQLAISLKSRLTPEQIAKLEELQKAATPVEKDAGANDELLAIKKAMQEVQQMAMARQQAGDDISAVKELVSGVKPLVEQGRFDEAKARLEKAKGMLK